LCCSEKCAGYVAQPTRFEIGLARSAVQSIDAQTAKGGAMKKRNNGSRESGNRRGATRAIRSRAGPKPGGAKEPHFGDSDAEVDFTNANAADDVFSSLEGKAYEYVSDHSGFREVVVKIDLDTGERKKFLAPPPTNPDSWN
jgi:hypothetical protein